MILSPLCGVTVGLTILSEMNGVQIGHFTVTPIENVFLVLFTPESECMAASSRAWLIKNSFVWSPFQEFCKRAHLAEQQHVHMLGASAVIGLITGRVKCCRRWFLTDGTVHMTTYVYVIERGNEGRLTPGEMVDIASVVL
jgi:hypothetical protein